MKRTNSMLTRFLAFALALVLVVTGMHVGAGNVYAAAKTVTDGDIVAGNYTLTDGEKALLKSGMFVGESHTYNEPTEADDLIAVDTDAKTVTVSDYEDAGRTWTPQSVKLVYSDGTGSDTLTGSDGVYSYTYTGAAFSIEVEYAVKATVSTDTQTKLFNGIKYLKEGKSELDTTMNNEDRLRIYRTANEYLYQLATDGISYGAGTFRLSDAAAGSAVALYNEITANGDQLQVVTMANTYKNSSRTQYLLTTGEELHAKVVETYNHLDNIMGDSVFTTLRDTTSNLSAALAAYNPAAYNVLVDSFIPSMDAWLDAMYTVIEPDTWPEGQSKGFLKEDVNYSTLDSLVSGLPRNLTPVTISGEELIAATAIVKKNMSMSNVIVKVVWEKVNESNVVEVYKTKVADPIALPDGSTAEVIMKAIQDAGAEEAAKTDWLALDEGFSTTHYTATKDVVSGELSGDLEYVITYSPVEYTITGGAVDGKHPYGYTLTLPTHEESPEMVYDYTVDGKYMPEGSTYTIEKDVEITRQPGPARDTKSLLTIVLDDSSLTSDERTILTSKAVSVGTDEISIRYPADSSVALDEENNIVTAQEVRSDYPGQELYWIPTKAIVTSGTADTPVSLVKGDAGYTGQITVNDYDKVTVVYSLEIPKDAGAVKNMPNTLVSEAENQLSRMAMLVDQKDDMADVAYDILDMLRKYAKDDTLTQLENILNNCYEKDMTKLDLYYHVVDYDSKTTDAEKLLYYYQNRDVMDKHLQIIVDALAVIKDDAEFKDTCILKLGDQATKAFGQLDDIKDKLDKVVLPAPNAAIKLNSDSLLSLAEVLVNSATKVNEHASANLVLTKEIIKEAEGRVTITVNMSQGANTGSFSMTFSKEVGKPNADQFDKLYADAFALLNIKDAELKYYTFEGTSADVIKAGTYAESKTFDLSWTPTEYDVVIDDVNYGKVSINNKTITLPSHEDPEMEYRYTVNGVEGYKQGDQVSVDLDAVIASELKIARDEVNVKEEEEKTKFESFKNEISKASSEAVEFAFSEEDTVLTMEVDVEAEQGALMAGITNFVKALANQQYKEISLNGEVLYAGGNVSIQTLVNAMLNDANFNNDGLADAATTGAPLLTAEMQLGSGVQTFALRSGASTPKTIDFIVKISGTKAQLTNLANALKAVKPYVEFQANNGKLNVELNLPEKVYEVYLTALVAVGQVNISDINAVNTAIATMFIYDYMNGIITDDAITTATFQKTLEILDEAAKDKLPNYDLTQYETRYQQLRTVLNNWTTVTEVSGAPQVDIAIPAKTAIDKVIAKTGANVEEGILEQIVEYENNDPIEATVVVTIGNTNEDFEALVIDLDALKDGAKELKAGVTKDKLVALVKGQGIANGVDYTSDLVARMATVTGPAAIVLLNDVTGNLTINTTTALDLNGKTITGNVNANGHLYIFNSQLATNAPGGVDGTVSGNVTITGGNYTKPVDTFVAEGYEVVGGVVQNTLYTIDTADGNINFIVNTDVIDEDIDSYVSYAKALAAEVALDVAMNAYPYAMLAMNKHDIYGFTYDDYIGLLANSNTAGEAVDTLLDCISLPGMSEFINDVMKDLLDFGAIKGHLENDEVVATYSVTTAPWKLVVRHETNGDYITGGLVADEASETTRNITLKFVGDNNEAVASLFGWLDEIVETAEVKFVDVKDLTFNNKHFDLTGGMKATLVADMSNYTTYMAIVLANALEGDARKAMVDAVNAGDEVALKDAFDAITVKDVANALKVLERGDTFAKLAEEVKINAKIDLSKNQKLMEKAMVLTMAAAGRALEELDITGNASKLGSLDKDDDGVYDFAGAISKSATVTKRGYGVNFNLTKADANVSVRLFGEECLWGDANHDGKVNSHDAYLVLCEIIDKPTEESFCTIRTDVNQDGKLNSHDANLILQYVIGKVQSLPYND